jgi:hypothetical protein
MTAATIANQKEFQLAAWLAAIAPGNSVQVRFNEISWSKGNPADRKQSKSVAIPQIANHARPSCRRKSSGETVPSSLGHAKSARARQIKSTSGITNNGQLRASIAPGESVALNRTQISAGRTFTCKIAGTAKLFIARTKISTALCVSATRAIGNKSLEISFHPVKAVSLSS